MRFEIIELRSSTVWSLYRMRDRIQLDPDYQRMSDIWTLDKRQLLVDTILNDFDIPKIYLHKFIEPISKKGKIFDYAIIDGKQRLETMWAFLDGKIPLAQGFEYFKDVETKAENMTYQELGKEYPDLKAQFDNFKLTVICIETNDLEMIEEMFLRLNESAPLSAPEKRIAYGGPLPIATRKLASEIFFTSRLPFSNKRYRHFDLATKFLLSESAGKVIDTKKAYLDKFVEDYANEPRNKMPPFLKKAKENVARMSKVFSENDPLLRQVGMVILYYHLFRMAAQEGWADKIKRKILAEFENKRETNRKMAEQDFTSANYNLLEFDRYSQSPNDSYAIKLRLKILLEEALKKKVSIEGL